MAKLRHLAMSVPDPEATAKFYMDAFDMKLVGRTNSPLAKGCYVSDGVITVALLNFKNDDQGPREFVGLHHLGFWVDDLDDAEKQVEKAGATYLMGRPEKGDTRTMFYEEKYKDPNGVIFDITELGWGGATKEVVAAPGTPEPPQRSLNPDEDKAHA
jgi:catechol 2,3-dioxygenase-like lactoylglutathione lyase family enzyme